MFKFLNNFFHYSRSQKNGIIVLLFLIIVVFIAPKFVNMYAPNKNLDYSEFESQIERIESQPGKINKEKLKQAYFNFDPNIASKQDMLKLGLSSNQAKNVINYRNAGGIFNHPNDLMQLYTIDSQLYYKLKPYVVIYKKQKAEKEHMSITASEQKEKTAPSIKENLFIELNSADSIDLIKLDGIGAKLSRRIINYRNYLGGFTSKKQLLEVYGLKQNAMDKIANNIVIDSSLVQLININNADFKTLSKHPYLSYVDTKKILKYRQLMGGLTNISELLENNLVDQETYLKIYPYLTLK